MLKKLFIIITFFLLLPCYVSAAPESVKFSQEMQDSSDGLALMAPAMSMVQIPFQMLSGDKASAQETLNKSLADVNVYMQKNSNSPLAYYLRGALREIARAGSGTEDFKKLAKISSSRMKEEPNYIGNYEMRAKAFEQLGHLPEAKADLLYALKLTSDPVKRAEIQKDISELGKK